MSGLVTGARTAACAGADRAASRPRLILTADEPLAPRWVGDDELDRGLDAADTRAAAAAWFGAERTTRPVVRALGASLLGHPTWAVPGRNLNLFAVSVALSVDPDDLTTAIDVRSWPGVDGSMTSERDPDLDLAAADVQHRLAPDDIARVLAATLDDHAVSRREPLRRFDRETLRQLVTGWTRRQRRDLALAIVLDEEASTDRFLRALRDAAELAHVGRFVTPHLPVERLTRYVEHIVGEYRVPSRQQPLTAARHWRSRPSIELAHGWQVRVPWNRRLLEEEGAAFENCLGGWYLPVHLHGRLVATVYRHGYPMAAAEIGPDNEIVEILGARDEKPSVWLWQRAESALIDAGVVAGRHLDDLDSAGQRIAARIACRSAVLLAPWREPSHEHPGLAIGEPEPGEATLDRLGARAELLTDAEFQQLRDGTESDPLTGWAITGAMLMAAGIEHPHLASLDGRALFRHVARELGAQMLDRTLESEQPIDPDILRRALAEPNTPGWQCEGFEDVLRQYR